MRNETERKIVFGGSSLSIRGHGAILTTPVRPESIAMLPDLTEALSRVSVLFTMFPMAAPENSSEPDFPGIDLKIEGWVRMDALSPDLLARVREELGLGIKP